MYAGVGPVQWDGCQIPRPLSADGGLSGRDVLRYVVLCSYYVRHPLANRCMPFLWYTYLGACMMPPLVYIGACMVGECDRTASQDNKRLQRLPPHLDWPLSHSPANNCLSFAAGLRWPQSFFLS